MTSSLENTLPTVRDFAPQIILGTVQLGIPYGISNQSGKPDLTQAFELLDCALEAGVTCWDTARTYGESESVLGAFIKSRKAHARVKMGSKSLLEGGRSLTRDVEASLLELGIEALDFFMFHREGDLAGDRGPEVWAELQGLQKAGKIQKLGVSSYDPDILEGLIGRYPIEVVQVPFSVLDRRYERFILNPPSTASQLEVHLRSVYVQGLVFMQAENLPPKMEFAKNDLAALHQIATREKSTLAELSLSYCLGLRNTPNAAPKCVLGFNSARELRATLEQKVRPISKQALHDIDSVLNQSDPRLVRPHEWPR